MAHSPSPTAAPLEPSPSPSPKVALPLTLPLTLTLTLTLTTGRAAPLESLSWSFLRNGCALCPGSRGRCAGVGGG
eukprot:scaffold28747_cov53-Phaeocystis_antarctica.AAC.2